VEAEKELIELDAVNFLSLGNLSSGNWWFLSCGLFRHGLSCHHLMMSVQIRLRLYALRSSRIFNEDVFWFGRNANRTW
jgi:hypothetical protein